jgi:hypothetical protein
LYLTITVLARPSSNLAVNDKSARSLAPPSSIKMTVSLSLQLKERSAVNKDHTVFIWRGSISRSFEVSNRFAVLEN